MLCLCICLVSNRGPEVQRGNPLFEVTWQSCPNDVIRVVPRVSDLIALTGGLCHHLWDRDTHTHTHHLPLWGFLAMKLGHIPEARRRTNEHAQGGHSAGAASGNIPGKATVLSETQLSCSVEALAEILQSDRWSSAVRILCAGSLTSHLIV